MQSARAFLTGIIDYAGLFPPASLEMGEAVRAYAKYVSGPDRDLLGRFVVPANRLPELAEAASVVFATGNPGQRGVSVIGRDAATASKAAMEFNSASRADPFVCDVLELTVANTSDVETALDVVPPEFQLYLEVPVSKLMPDIVYAMRGTRASAKIRTGGVVPPAIPSPASVLRLMRECSRAGVPFKATAGLHHAIRARYALTYEKDAPVAELFGYLNVFAAAAGVAAGWPDEVVLDVLEEHDPAQLRFDDAGLTWRDRTVDREALERCRSQFAHSFGSCSFSEPVEEARALGLI